MTATRSDLRSLSMQQPEGSLDVPRPRSRWRTRLLIPLLVLLAAIGLLAYAARDHLQPAIDVYVTPMIPKAVGVAPSTSNDATPTAAKGGGDALGPVLVQAPGWIEPAPYSIGVPVLADGVVKEVLVLEGQRVEAGQVVARMIDDDAKLQLRMADAAIDARTADIERAKATTEAADAQVKVEQAEVDAIEDEITRKRDLVKGGGVGAGEFRRLEIRAIGLKAKVNAAERFADESRAAVKQAESSLAAAKVARDEAQLRLDRMEIHSPASGVVLTRLVGPGARFSMANSGESNANGAMLVLRIYDPNQLQARVDVPLADAAKIGIGTRAVLVTEALPDTNFTGTVIRSVHEANIQRNTVQFKVSVDHPSPVLKPEMLVRVKLHNARGGHSSAATPSIATAADSDNFALLVPIAAMTKTGDAAATVWIVDASSGSTVARKKNIAVASSSDDGYAIATTGLHLTDRLILNPPPSLSDGARIRVLGERTANP